jgi:hypothetical protein
MTSVIRIESKHSACSDRSRPSAMVWNGGTATSKIAGAGTSIDQPDSPLRATRVTTGSDEAVRLNTLRARKL